jgi:hypothetical protein
VQDGRIHVEKFNAPFLYVDKGTPDEHAAGLELAIKRGWLEEMDRSGTFVRFGQARRTMAPLDMRRAPPPRVHGPGWPIQVGSDSWPY